MTWLVALFFLIPNSTWANSCGSVPLGYSEEEKGGFSADDSLRYAYLQEDTVVFNNLVEYIRECNADSLDFGEFIIKVGLFFKDREYVSKSLEGARKEQVVLNLHGFDCVTFVESTLALAFTLKEREPTFLDYGKQLERVRYRNGIKTDYCSRLHYFSDWIFDNSARGNIENVSCDFDSVPYTDEIFYITKNKEKYFQVNSDSSVFRRMKEIESSINERNYCYLPKQDIDKYRSLVRNGDIIAMTTNVNGLDITHVGIAIFQGEELHLLHASSSLKKVIISPSTLKKFAEKNSHVSGIMVARPISPGN